MVEDGKDLLTPQELAVIKEIGEGATSYKDVGKKLCRSEHTVRNQLQSSVLKLDILFKLHHLAIWYQCDKHSNPIPIKILEYHNRQRDVILNIPNRLRNRSIQLAICSLFLVQTLAIEIFNTADLERARRSRGRKGRTEYTDSGVGECEMIGLFD